MPLLLALLAVLIALPAAAAEVPKKWHASMQEQMLRDQKLVQTLTGDIDGDGKEEWISVGEPTGKLANNVSIAIFEPAKGKQPPKLRFAQRLQGKGLERAGAVVRKISPIGNGVVLVGAAPSQVGDSDFTLQIYGWNGKMFRPLVPEIIDFRSQGGFSIEDVDPSTPGDEVVAWTYLRGDREQLFDQHHYAYVIYRWDGIRWVGPQRESQSPEKLPGPEAAGRLAGAKKGDLRRQMPRVAEVP
ncbi:hypothetical protein [Vulgatibacter sp.]|uniref:hypothetical protein n=1 Tax=Vulgatibacter sp. TaxID=1971226 RepID=UPI003565519E